MPALSWPVAAIGPGIAPQRAPDHLPPYSLAEILLATGGEVVGHYPTASTVVDLCEWEPLTAMSVATIPLPSSGPVVIRGRRAMKATVDAAHALGTRLAGMHVYPIDLTQDFRGHLAQAITRAEQKGA